MSRATIGAILCRRMRKSSMKSSKGTTVKGGVRTTMNTPMRRGGTRRSAKGRSGRGR